MVSGGGSGQAPQSHTNATPTALALSWSSRARRGHGQAAGRPLGDGRPTTPPRGPVALDGGDVVGVAATSDRVCDCTAGFSGDEADNPTTCSACSSANEFADVERSYIPMHSVIRIDEVTRRGTAKVTPADSDSKVRPFPVYTRQGPGGGGQGNR